MQRAQSFLFVNFFLEKRMVLKYLNEWKIVNLPSFRDGSIINFGLVYLIMLFFLIKSNILDD